MSSWIYSRNSNWSDVFGNIWSRGNSREISSGSSPRFLEHDKKLSQLDPLDILCGAPNLSRSSVLDGSREETRMCEYRPPGSERLWRRQELVKEFLNKSCRLLFIYGEMFLGKAHFAQEIIKTLRKHRFESELPVRCLGMTSFESLMTSIGSSLGFPPPYTESNVIKRLNSASWYCSFVLLFTNFEDIISQDQILRRFSTFLNDMLTACPNVAVIVTSRVKVDLVHEDFSVIYKLDPPSEAECCRLLQPILPFCKTYEPIFLIVRRCFHRPSFILRVCHIILSNRTIISPEDIAEMLKTPNGLLDLFSRYQSPEGSITEAIKRQLSRLPKELESDTRMLCLLDGTFRIVEATKKLQKNSLTEFKVMTLAPLRDHAILDIDMCSGQIKTDPLIRQFILHDSQHMRDNDPYRKLIVDFLGYVLMMMRGDISVRTKGRALGFAQDNFHRLERTLTQAVHTDGEDTYGVYMELIELEEGSMSAVCPDKAIPFYKAMVDASARFGTNRDHALLQGLLAVALIEQRGDELDSAVAMVTDSLSHMTEKDNYLRVVLMRRLGWMNIRLGNNEEAKRLLTDAKEISTRVPEALAARVEPHRIQINSHLAITNVFLGKFHEAQNLLVSTIPRAKKIMPDHPVLAVLLQTMGLKYEREGLVDKAIVSYKVSGNERRKLEATLPSYLVTNQNNQASRYLWRGETEKALPLLESSLNIRRKLGWWDYNTALTLWYRGNAYLFSCRPEEAERSLNQAKEVLIRCTPSHTSIVNIFVSLAHAYMAQGRHPEAERQLKQALNHTASFQRNIIDDSLLTALEHLVLMKRGTAEVGDIHKSLIKEAERLSDVFKDGDRVKHVLMQRKLTDWRVYLGMVLGEDSSKSPRNRQEDSAKVNERELKIGSGEMKNGGNGSPSTETNLKVDWSALFTCEHCKMLKYTHGKWLQT